MPYTKLQQLIAGALAGIIVTAPFIGVMYLFNLILPVWAQHITAFVTALFSMLVLGLVVDKLEHVVKEHNSKYQ